MEIQRIDSYTDPRFPKEVLYQHGAFLVDGAPWTFRVISDHEAEVAGEGLNRETLAEAAVGFARSLGKCRLLDLCTGSGCIALALSRALRFADIDAMDISQAALDVARENAETLGCNINLIPADALQLPACGLSEVKNTPQTYDIIASNPPYVLDSEATEMDARVLDHEPKTALFVPDSDPLKFYRPISEYARKALRPGGMLFFEINPKEAAAMSKMLYGLGFGNVEIHNDYLGRKRFATAAV